MTVENMISYMVCQKPCITERVDTFGYQQIVWLWGFQQITMRQPTVDVQDPSVVYQVFEQMEKNVHL